MAKASFHNDRVKFYTWSLLKLGLFEKDQNAVMSTANNVHQILHFRVATVCTTSSTGPSTRTERSTITGVADVGVADASSIIRDDPEWMLLTEGKTAGDVAGNREGIGQLLMAVMTAFLKHGKTVWGAALAPTKLTILKMKMQQEEGEEGQQGQHIIVQHCTSLCDGKNPFCLWPLLRIAQMC